MAIVRVARLENLTDRGNAHRPAVGHASRGPRSVRRPEAVGIKKKSWSDSERGDSDANSRPSADPTMEISRRTDSMNLDERSTRHGGTDSDDDRGDDDRRLAEFASRRRHPGRAAESIRREIARGRTRSARTGVRRKIWPDLSGSSRRSGCGGSVRWNLPRWKDSDILVVAPKSGYNPVEESRDARSWISSGMVFTGCSIVGDGPFELRAAGEDRARSLEPPEPRRTDSLMPIPSSRRLSSSSRHVPCRWITMGLNRIPPPEGVFRPSAPTTSEAARIVGHGSRADTPQTRAKNRVQ